MRALSFGAIRVPTEDLPQLQPRNVVCRGKEHVRQLRARAPRQLLPPHHFDQHGQASVPRGKVRSAARHNPNVLPRLPRRPNLERRVGLVHEVPRGQVRAQDRQRVQGMPTWEMVRRGRSARHVVVGVRQLSSRVQVPLDRFGGLHREDAVRPRPLFLPDGDTHRVQVVPGWLDCRRNHRKQCVLAVQRRPVRRRPHGVQALHGRTV